MYYSLLVKDNTSPHFKEADEIHIMLRRYTENKSKLLDWIKDSLSQTQRLVVEIEDTLPDPLEEELNLFSLIAEAHPYMAFCLSVYNKDKEKLLDFFKSKEIKFFYSEYIDSWDKLNCFLAEGVSDIRIVNELGFSLQSVRKVAPAANIRVFPNVAQTNAKIPSSIDDLTKFFIRPEDTLYYEPYVDFFEFYAPLKQQDVYFRIYKRGSWTGSLSLLIKEFNIDVVGAQLVRFGSSRVNCNKGCAKGEACSICKKALALSTVLNDMQIGLKKEPLKEHYTKEEAATILKELKGYTQDLEEEKERRELEEC